MANNPAINHKKNVTPDELKELSDWWQEHGNLISTLILVVAVAIFGVRFWKARAASRAEQASAAIASASSLDDLEQVVSEFPSSGDAPAALLKIASRHCRRGDYAVARERYTDFLRKYASHDLVPVARLGIAFTDENDGRLEEALAAYEKHLADFGDKDYLAPVATLGKARCLAFLGREDEARTVLDQMTADKSNTEWAIHADDLKAVLPRMKFVKSSDFAANLDAVLADLPAAPAAAPAAPETAAPEAPAEEAAPAPAPEAPAADAPAAEPPAAEAAPAPEPEPSAPVDAPSPTAPEALP